jgi:hypothetical protein
MLRIVKSCVLSSTQSNSSHLAWPGEFKSAFRKEYTGSSRCMSLGTPPLVNVAMLTRVFTSIDSLRLLQPVFEILRLAHLAVGFEIKAFNESSDKVGKTTSFP